MQVGIMYFIVATLLPARHGSTDNCRMSHICLSSHNYDFSELSYLEIDLESTNPPHAACSNRKASKMHWIEIIINQLIYRERRELRQIIYLLVTNWNLLVLFLFYIFCFLFVCFLFSTLWFYFPPLSIVSDICISLGVKY